MGTFVVSDDRSASRKMSEAETANLQVVLDYYRDMVEKLSFEAVRPYVNEDFLDHNPAIPEGDLEALRAFCDGPLAHNFADIHVDVRHIMVDGAHVLLRIDGRLRAGDRTDMVMEIFRLRDGRISEHWELVGAGGAAVIGETVGGAPTSRPDATAD